MAEYGLITDVDTTKQQLKEYNRDYYNRRTWGGLETDLALSAQAANAALQKDYGAAMLQAYNASQANQRSINASGVVGSQRQALLMQNQTALEEAYNTYMNNFQQGQQEIAKNYSEGVEQIDTALTQEAQNIIDYKKKHEDYLQYLYYQYQMGNNTLFDNIQWSKFLTKETDEQGNVLNRLKTLEELYKPTFIEHEDEQGNKYKEWTGLVDDEGNLTQAGVDFFDQLSNIGSTDTTLLGDSATFGNFLANTDTEFLMNEYGYTKSEAEKIAQENADLLKWSQTYNPYNYTMQGTNKGTFRTMVGMMSTDDAYSFAERWGGLSSEQIDGLFKEYKDAAETLDKKVSNSEKAKNKGHAITKEVQDLVESAHTLAKDLGIDAELDINWDQLKADALAYHAGTMSEGEMTARWFADTTASTVGGIITGMSIGAGAGSTAGPLGTAVGAGAGLTIGSIIGAIVGISVGSARVDQFRKQNKQMAQNSKQLFDNMLAQMTSFAAYNKRQKDIEFAQHNA